MFERSDEDIEKYFYKLATREDIANILEIKEKSLRYFLYSKEQKNKYKKFKIKKKNGSERIIYAPNSGLKGIQKKLSYILNVIYKPKICAYGFIKNKNIIDNAKNHTKSRMVLNIDLKDFFTQIHFGRVRGMLMNKPYSLSDEAATTIAQISCVDGFLPQGSPSSPVLTNMICKPLDNQLLKLSKKNKIKYTRYADDITFSTYGNFSHNIVFGEVGNLRLGRELEDILTRNSFLVNEDKIFLNSNQNRQEVTGLIVNNFPNIKREYIKNIRAILYCCEKKGVYNAAILYIKKGFCKNSDIVAKYKDPKNTNIVELWFKNVLKGKINFIKQVRGKDNLLFLKFADQLNHIFDEKIFDISILDDFNDQILKNVFVIDDKVELIQGSGFLLKDYGLFTSFHVTQSGGFFDVSRYNEYEQNIVMKISKNMNEISSNQDIDYALYKYDREYENYFELGDSKKLKQGDQVTIIGYPEFQYGNSYYIQKNDITSITNNYLGAVFYTFGGRVVHGASGGVVLNEARQVVGILKGGRSSLEDDRLNDKQGFIPMHIVIDDLNSAIIY